MLPRLGQTDSVSSEEFGAGGPWYRAHPRAVLAVAGGLYALVTVLESVDTDAADAIALLYMLPIALIAVSFGLRGGLAAAAVGYACFSVFAVTDSTGYLGADGWATRAGAMFLLGGLLGRAADQSARANNLALENQRERLLLQAQNRRYANGIELSDTVLQHVAAAKWMIDAGNPEEASRLLSTAMEQGQRIVSDLLPGQQVSAVEETPASEHQRQPAPPGA